MDKIYRCIAVLLMLVVFFLQTFSNAIIEVNYYLNTTAYARNCENKDKPWLHCNGKCQVRKQIQQENKKDQDTPEHRGSAKNTAPLFTGVAIHNTCLPLLAPYTKATITPYCIGRSIDQPFAIFHPPQA